MIDENQSLLFVIILAIAVIALILTRRLMKSSFPYVFIGIVGLILGLLVGALLSLPLQRLPGDYGKWLPMIVNIFAAVAVLDLFLGQAKTFSRYFRSVVSGNSNLAGVDLNILPEILVDTSTLIDGRIIEMAETGFLIMPLAVPDFVVDELQRLADSKDPLKREKGKRGIETLEALKQSNTITLRLIDKNGGGETDVDKKLVLLAKDRATRILTVDAVLSRTATIQGIAVLNMNDLANSLKPVIYPGEEMKIEVVQKGRGKGQGVGYLIDGTMVVIEGGDKLVGKEVHAKVVRIFQTATGRMLFAEPVEKL